MSVDSKPSPRGRGSADKAIAHLDSVVDKRVFRSGDRKAESSPQRKQRYTEYVHTSVYVMQESSPRRSSRHEARRNDARGRQEDMRRAQSRRKSYAVMPETSPPDAKQLPVPMFVKASFSSNAAREIKDLLRIL